MVVFLVTFLALLAAGKADWPYILNPAFQCAVEDVLE